MLFNFLTSSGHIFLAIFIYFAFAVSASLIARKIGIDLKEMAGRTSPTLLVIGASANVGALIATLILIKTLDSRPVSSLGLAFQPIDLAFSILAASGTFGLAFIFVNLLKRRGRVHVTAHKPARGLFSIMNLAAGLVVLLVVAIQEEVLYRGYMFLNMAQFGPAAFLIGSTLIFVGIHFLTNRVNLHQVISWTLSGLILAVTYLISGSIWVAVVLHFAIDATNVLVFNITGQFSLFTISPALTEQDRIGYRLIYGLAMLAAILAFYGPGFRLS
jgi:membrane protease YdiL (CAAX protease family)